MKSYRDSWYSICISCKWAKKVTGIASVSSIRKFLHNVVKKNLFDIPYDIIKQNVCNKLNLNRISEGNGISTNTYKDSRNEILKFHFPYISDDGIIESTSLNTDNQCKFTIEEIPTVIDSLEDNKSPGIDGLTNGIIKELFYADKWWFAKVMNCSFENNGIFPTKWKIANVTLIPKEGKDTSLPSSYRPICLLSCWGKVLDLLGKVFIKRLVDFFENKKLISENKFGFRGKKSTIDALRKAIEFVEEMKVNNKIVAMVSLDIKNAFNSARWSDIKMLLNKYYMPKQLCKIFGNFLQNRSVPLENEMEP
ncbi:RNA-directed DNA polymerase from mobile element jockey [Araneus ventricosus]|uniref:RNA-directed DNA polymerase from mobile element jockey n=1 Tax=Araneus ventricosus TaxID=182803 RepID=A0A4Y2CFX9_ARAVE|nr:RNA-directed DNA polymerase from mobile element jockey [Araneus ventricosus]